MLETRGRTRLARALDARVITQVKIADATGAWQSMVSGWRNGTTRPDAYQQAALERLLGIARDEWLTSEERLALAGIRRLHANRLRNVSGARQRNARTRRNRAADRA